MIRTEDICKAFDGVVAVDALSLEIQPGRILGFLGPNGAGKTTTIRMLMNILQPDSGNITFNGSTQRPAATQVGYLPEERGLYQKIPVLETLEYFAHLRGMKHPTASIKAALERFDLASRAHSKISELSKGNQQKVQFINTILHNPDYIILDEPFTGLDPVNQLIIKEMMEAMKDQGKTIIFSSHQMDQVEKLCDDVALINNGELVLSGDLDSVKRQNGELQLEVILQQESDAHNPVFAPLSMRSEGPRLSISLGDENPQQLMATIAGAVPCRSILVAQPGLEEIFITHVKGVRA